MVVGLLERSRTLVATPVGSPSDRKVVLLTGASGPIGTAFCQRFASEYDVVAVRHRRPLKVASQLQHWFDPFDEPSVGVPDGSVFEIRGDLLQKADVERIVELTLARFGRVDAIVNAVGFPARGRDLFGAGLRQAPEAFQINAMAPLNVAAAVAVQYWRLHDLENKSRNRVVVNLSAAASVDTSDSSFSAALAASKAALNVMSLHLAEELRPFNVRVVSVAPSAVPDVVTPERVAAAVRQMIEGDDNGRLLLMWDEEDELV